MRLLSEFACLARQPQRQVALINCASIRRFVPLAAFPFALTCGVCWAASFDCNSQRLTVTESAVCKSSTLSEMDSSLSTFYAWLRTRYPPDYSAVLRREQQAWLSHRNGCKEDQCLIDAYRSRVAALTQNSGISPEEAARIDGQLASSAVPTDVKAIRAKLAGDWVASVGPNPIRLRLTENTLSTGGCIGSYTIQEVLPGKANFAHFVTLKTLQHATGICGGGGGFVVLALDSSLSTAWWLGCGRADQYRDFLASGDLRDNKECSELVVDKIGP